MAREDVIKEIRRFMEKWHMEEELEKVSFEEHSVRNCVIVRGSCSLYSIVHMLSYVSEFNDLPRDVKDIVIEEHPEIMQEFEDEFEDFEQYLEQYDFPDRIEFDSEEEYQKLKEQFLYEEREKYISNYWNPLEKYNVGGVAAERLERYIEKCGFNIMYDFEKYEDSACKNMVFFEY